MKKTNFILVVRLALWTPDFTVAAKLARKVTLINLVLESVSTSNSWNTWWVSSWFLRLCLYQSCTFPWEVRKKLYNIYNFIQKSYQLYSNFKKLFWKKAFFSTNQIWFYKLVSINMFEKIYLNTLIKKKSHNPIQTMSLIPTLPTFIQPLLEVSGWILLNAHI